MRVVYSISRRHAVKRVSLVTLCRRSRSDSFDCYELLTARNLEVMDIKLVILNACLLCVCANCVTESSPEDVDGLL